MAEEKGERNEPKSEQQMMKASFFCLLRHRFLSSVLPVFRVNIFRFCRYRRNAPAPHKQPRLKSTMDAVLKVVLFPHTMAPRLPEVD